MTDENKLVGFFEWFREKTEATWATYETRPFKLLQDDQMGGTDWQRGTRWNGGFSEADIQAFEKEWSIQFPPDYRLYLKVLGAPDRPCFAVWFENGDQLVAGEEHVLLDLRDDPAVIERKLRWPAEGLLRSVEHGEWWPAWGEKPATLQERQQKLSGLLNQAPSLIPVYGHRYLVGLPLEAGNPVLSVMGSDIIVYGLDLPRYLQTEFSDLLQGQRFWNRLPWTESEEERVSSIPFWGMWF